MANLIFILGRSGTGKSYSLRKLPCGKWALINVQAKMLPFRGAAEVEQTCTDDSNEILKALERYAKDYDIIVVDDYQYVMSNEFMRRSYEKGYDKFTEIARHAWDIANKVRELPASVNVYIMCHTDRDDDGNEKIKTIGKLLDEKICLEGLSTIVLKTNVSDGQYTFLTQNNGKDTVKSPAGMFPSYAIDNDLWYVDQKIRNYYGMKGHVSDEEMAAADQEVAKPEIVKPDADGRRRRKATVDPAAAVNPAGETPEEQKAFEQELETPETPKRRSRKERNGKTEEEKPAEAPAEETKEETGRKRRRRKVDPEFSRPVAVSDDDDDELPFD